MKKHCCSIRCSFALALTITCLTHLAAVAQLPNAWQVDDPNGTSGSTPHYTTTLSNELQADATNLGFRFAINARMISSASASPSMIMLYGLGTERFVVRFDLDSNGDLIAALEGGGTYTLTTNSTGTTLYHTHEIVYDPSTSKASYVFDGQVKTTEWTASSTDFAAGAVFWGSGSSGGQGVMNFHSVSFEINNNVVAGYDAGISPDGTPNPDTQGWTYVQIAAGAVSEVSPDTVPVPTIPVATTLTSTEVEPYQATLSGAIDQGNLAATVWFEWGTNTGYGNITPKQQLLSDTNLFNLSETITGLVKGTTYHFRCVATNLQGVAYGEDRMFSTPETMVVTTQDDHGYGSLRQSIEHAQPGDTITFANAVTITLTSGQIVIDKDLNIDASAWPEGIAISGNNASRVFEIVNGAAVTMNQLTIRDGDATGQGGTLVIPNYDAGGGILNSFSSLVLTGCVLTNNTAFYGGALGNGGGQLTLNNCSIIDNHASSRGAGLYHTAGLLSLTQQANVLIIECMFKLNDASSAGGAIYQDGADVIIRNSDFLNNTSGAAGGALQGEVGGIGGPFNVNLEISDSVFSKNGAFDGGALSVGARTNTLINCTLANNFATHSGGALYTLVTDGAVTLSGSTLSGNSAGENGGGIYNYGATYILKNSTLTGNSASSEGGGIYQHEATGTTEIINSIVAGNTAVSSPNVYGTFDNVSLVSSLTGGDPLLAPLGDYGGPTQTMPPLARSPAIDAGNDTAAIDLTIDQRGYPRTSGAHVDIGAAEYQIPSGINPAPLLSPTQQPDGNVGFSFVNSPNLDFTVVASHDIALPLIQWLPIGLMSQGAPGEYQYVDPQATNSPSQFYQVVAP